MARALILLADGFDERDVIDLANRLDTAGFEVVYGGTERGAVVTGAGGKTVTLDAGYLNFNMASYTLVVVPGGPAGTAIAEHKSLVNAVYTAAHRGRAVAAIGTGIQAVLAAAKIKSPYAIESGVQVMDGDLVKGRQVAATGELAAAVEGAGGHAVEGPVAVDGPLVTATDTADRNLVDLADLAIATARTYQTARPVP